jgi:hypothetical protein
MYYYFFELFNGVFNGFLKLFQPPRIKGVVNRGLNQRSSQSNIPKSQFSKQSDAYLYLSLNYAR